MSDAIIERQPEGVTYPDVGEHFTKMAPRYEVGCQKVNWQGPIAVFSALQAEIERRQAQLSHVLDLGAGTGQLADLFKEWRQSVHVTGLEYAKGMFEQLLTNPNVNKAVHGDARDLSWSTDNQFDAATCSGVLDFIDDTQAFAREACRVVKPNGLVVVTYEPQGSPNPGVDSLKHDTNTLVIQFERAGADVLSVGTHENIFKNFRTGRPVTNNLLMARVA